MQEQCSRSLFIEIHLISWDAKRGNLRYDFFCCFELFSSPEFFQWCIEVQSSVNTDLEDLSQNMFSGISLWLHFLIQMTSAMLIFGVKLSVNRICMEITTSLFQKPTILMSHDVIFSHGFFTKDFSFKIIKKQVKIK